MCNKCNDTGVIFIPRLHNFIPMAVACECEKGKIVQSVVDLYNKKRKEGEGCRKSGQ